MYRAITTKVVILGIEYRYRSLSSIEVSSIDVIAGIVLTLFGTSSDVVLKCPDILAPRQFVTGRQLPHLQNDNYMGRLAIYQ